MSGFVQPYVTVYCPIWRTDKKVYFLPDADGNPKANGCEDMADEAICSKCREKCQAKWNKASES